MLAREGDEGPLLVLVLVLELELLELSLLLSLESVEARRCRCWAARAACMLITSGMRNMHGMW
jgi:hypothetical protein